MNKDQIARVVALLNSPELDEGVIAEIASLGDDGRRFLVEAASGSQFPVYVRQRAIAALGLLGWPDAAQSLVRLLQNPALRPHAIYALEGIKGAEVVKDLLPLLQSNEADHNARVHALEVIGHVPDQQAATELEYWVERERDPLLRAIGERALMRLRRRGVLPKPPRQPSTPR